MIATLLATSILSTAFGGFLMERAQPRAIREIESERERHIDLGHSFTTDAEHVDGELLKMASAYMHPDDARQWWPSQWRLPRSLTRPTKDGLHGWSDEDRRRNLVKAGSLIVAEIDRMDHAARKPKQRLSERQFQLLWFVALLGLGCLACGGAL